MAKDCMEQLKGSWGFSVEPIGDGKVQEILLNTDAKRKVKGTATIVIQGTPVKFDIEGVYNGGSVELRFRARSEDDQFNFSYVGNCEGVNIFNGPIFGKEPRNAQLKI